MMMAARLEIASRVMAALAYQFVGPTAYADAAEEALHFADALLAAHAATAKPALPDDAPVMEWRVGVQKVCRMEGYYWIMRADCGDSMARFDADDHSVKGEAECDLPAVRAAAEAYSAAKGCKAVFTGEGAGDDR